METNPTYIVQNIEGCSNLVNVINNSWQRLQEVICSQDFQEDQQVYIFFSNYHTDVTKHFERYIQHVPQ